MSLLLLLKETPSSHVVSRWELDETAGTTANDSVGTNDGNYTAVELGKASIIPASPGSHSARISGEGSYISIPDSESLRFKLGLTLKLWYEWTGDTGILAAREANWELALETGGVLRFAFRDPAGEWHEVATSEGALLEGKHRIDITYDRSDLRILVDGVEVASAEFSQELRGSEGDLWIGVQPGGEFQRCNGRYQRIELRSGARSVGDILTEYEEEAVAVWADFNGDFETGNFSQYLETQAPEGRATVVKSPVAEGEYAGHFEVQEGDPEVAGGHRAEAIPDKEFISGDSRYFRTLINLRQVDWSHWTIICQWHDTSKGSPPLCAMLVETAEGKRLRIQTGDSKSIYFDLPVPAEGVWFELVVHVVFEAEGSVEVWINGESQGKVSGVDPLGTEPTNFKCGIYRSADSVGTTELLHDGVKITDEFFSEPNPRPHSRIAVTREHVPDRLAVRMEDPTTGQTIARWAEDEAKVENTISGLTKVGEMDGGHKESGGQLARDPRVDWPDLDTFYDYIVEGAGREKLFEGRLEQKPQSDGERWIIEPKAGGHSKALEDRTGLRLGFIDSDLGKWGEPSTQRRVNLEKSNYMLNAGISIGWQGKGEEPPGINIDFTSVETAAEKIMRGEAWYYGGGITLGALLYMFKVLLGPEGGGGWADLGRLSDNDLNTEGTFQSGEDHNATDTTSYQRIDATASTRRYASMLSEYSDGGGTKMTDLHSWQQVKVLSYLAAQNLTLQGTWPEVGFTAKQILELAVPLYSYLEAHTEDIEDTEYVIPQAWYSDPTTLDAVVKDVLKYSPEMRWFILNGKRLEVRRAGTFGREWQAYAGPSELRETDEDGSRCWDRIVGVYQDVSGRTITIGYPGSGADYESAALQITDPDHPAVKAGRPREDLLNLNGISEPATALAALEQWLAEANELSHAGEATLRGYIQDSASVFRPVSQVQPGDRIRFPDAGSGGTDYREIVAVSYDHDSRTAQVTLDAPSSAISALLERYQAALLPLSLG